jgi:hypothetical protein
LRLLAAILLVLLFPASASALTLRGNVAPRHRAWVGSATVPLPTGAITITRSGCYFTWSCFDQGVIRLPKKTDSYAQERAVLLHELGHAFDERMLSPRERRAFQRAADVPGSWWANTETPPAEAFAEQYAACAMGTLRSELAPSLSFYDYDPGPPAERVICAALWGWAR